MATTTPTISDVAALAGVSSMTVSRVLKGAPGASDATRAAVKEAIEQLGYRRNGLASALRAGRSHSIGVVVPDISNPFFAEFVSGANLAAREHGLSLLLSTAAENGDYELAALRLFAEQQVDGVLVCSARSQDEVLKAALLLHRAVVLVNREVDVVGVGSIQVDYAAGMVIAVEHLIDRGRRNIAVLSGPASSRAALSRLSGARQALARHGLESRSIYPSTPDIAGGQMAARMALESGTRGDPDALLCYNDLVAIGALLAAAERGLVVPKDIAVIGCDDIQVAQSLAPPLTTLRIRQHEIGRMAFEMLAARITHSAGAYGHEPCRIVSPELIIRRST